MDARAIRQFEELEERHFWFVGRRAIFTALLERELPVGGGAEILDAGCGAGGMLGPLARFGHVRGIDPSPELVAHCHARGYPEVSLGSADALPVADASLDAITFFDVIEHIPDDRAVLGEAWRALRPGGLIVISVPAYGFLFANNDRVAHHERRYTDRGLRGKLREAGFTLTQVSYFNTLLFPAILPAVLAKKLLERFVDPGDATNLSHPLRPRLNRMLAATMSAERHLLPRMSFPAGHSIVALARRPPSLP